MLHHPLTIVDRTVATQFALLGSDPRLLHESEVWVDAKGIAWAGAQVGELGFGVSCLPGWHFDAHAAKRLTSAPDAARQRPASSNSSGHRRELEKVVAGVRLGRLGERVLWLIHQAVMAAHRSVIRVPDYLLARAVWGEDRPSHWRQDLLRILKGLTWLHLAQWPAKGRPAFGTDTALLTHAGDLRNDEADRCGPDCPGHQGEPHHHYLINIGRGFLGVLEQFGADDGQGTRNYSLVRGGPKSDGPSLWKVGKSGRLVTVFLPALLGDPRCCEAFSRPQRRLLQAIVREATRATRERRRSMSEMEVVSGNLVPVFHGRRQIECPLLDVNTRYVGFNGNKKRKRRGYRLATEGGWLAKAGYERTEFQAFLEDVAALSRDLRLIGVGIDRSNRFTDLDRLRSLAHTIPGRRTLDQVHFRLYTQEDFRERWGAAFGWDGFAAGATGAEQVGALAGEMRRKKVSGRALAAGIKKDGSFVAKLMKGIKPWPKGLLERARRWVDARPEPKLVKPVPKLPASNKPARTATPRKADGTMLGEALRLHDLGWCLVPQAAGEKMPLVKWKPYQDQRSSEQQLRNWFLRSPKAGLALILGPVSGVFAIDVDGQEAHDELCRRLGAEPRAVKSLSGSRKPFRYHLFFKHPQLPTKAKQTPWHSKLEFRGYRGIVVIPPSLHPSGKSYAWVDGQSPFDLELPDLPDAVFEALKPIPQPRRPAGPALRSVIISASKRTRELLEGRYAESSGWNQRLFNAACDLCGRGVPIDEAEPLLLAGACPWNRGEEELARRTIQSAYSQEREPARY